MPDKSKAHPKNAGGSWFVDDACISCDTCTDISPEIFGRDEERKAYVKERRMEDVSLFQFAMESCPVEAIGDEE